MGFANYFQIERKAGVLPVRTEHIRYSISAFNFGTLGGLKPA